MREFERTGKSRTRIYRIYRVMLNRCYNPNHAAYIRYGAKGVQVCERWKHSFKAFLEDMEPTYQDSLSIDRIDGGKGYSPDNCKWATNTEQANNRSSNIILTCYGKSQTLQQWSTECGISRDVLKDRIQKGWDLEQALTTLAKSKNSSVDVATLAELYAIGMTQSEIAKEFGVSQKTVCKFMKNNGLKARAAARRVGVGGEPNELADRNVNRA